MTKEKKIDYTTDIQAGTVTFNVVKSGKLTCDVRAWVGEKLYDTLPDIVREALLHGVKQKVGDGASNRRGPEAYTAMKAIWTNLQNGNFNSKREGGPRLNSLQTVAASYVWSVSEEEAVARLTRMDEKELKAFRKSATYRLEHSRENTRRLESEMAEAA